MRDDYDEVNNYLRLFNDKLLEKRSDSCDVSSLGNSANIFYYGNIIAVDKTEEAQYFKMAAINGKIDAMVSYANIIFNGAGISVNKTEAARYFKMVADKRNIEVMTMHAALLRNGN